MGPRYLVYPGVRNARCYKYAAGSTFRRELPVEISVEEMKQYVRRKSDFARFKLLKLALCFGGKEYVMNLKVCSMNFRFCNRVI
jgi:hypothetical protein